MEKIESIENSLDKKVLSSLCLYTISLLALLLLSYTPILDVGGLLNTLPLLFSIIILVILTIVVKVTNNNKNLKGAVLTITTLTAASVYVTFQAATILLFIFPVLLALLYNSKKLLVYTCVITVVSLLVSAIFSIIIKADGASIEVFKKISGLFVVGFSQLVVLIILTSIVFTRIQGLITENKSSEQTAEVREKVLDDILNHSQSLATVSNLYELHYHLKSSIMSLVSFYTNEESTVFHMGMITNGSYILDDINNYQKMNIDNNTIEIKCKNTVYSLDIASDNTDSVFIHSDKILIKLFDDSSVIKEVNEKPLPKINYYILVEGDFSNVDHSFESSLKMLQKTMETATNNLLWQFTLQSSQKEMIFAIAQVSESRSHQTGRHIIRVSEYMKILCKAAGYSDNEANKIGIASMLHDVGKLYIPSEIVEKKGKLTDDEFELMKQHVNFGVDLIRKCPGDVMEYARLMIKEHHERYDGNGYNHLLPSQTSFPSRLIAVADVFDALVSKRSYKDGWDPKEAYDLIISESGTHFDPECVKIFKKCFNELIYIHRKFPDEES